MRVIKYWSGLVGLLGFVGGIAAIAPPADAGYILKTTIAVPASEDNSVGGNFNTFDISFFDGSTQLDYVADRSNASVDIFSAATDTFVGRVGGSGQLFQGQKASNAASGPDGVVTTNLPGQHQLWAGDGNSTLKAFDIANAYAPIPPTTTSGSSGINTGGAFRVDEMAFDPKDNVVAAANNADTPPFVTLVNAANSTILKQVKFDGTGGTPNATGGIEQPGWDKNTQRFYISIVQVDGTGPGGIAQMDAAGNVTHFYDFANFGITSCGPTGLAVGKNSLLTVGCGNAGTQSILFDPTANGGNGMLIPFPQVSGGDEVWFDPTSDLSFVTAQNNIGGPVLGIIDDATLSWIQNVTTSPGAHSVAVDPVSGDAFVPFGGIAGNTTCETGCVAVFRSVPEPGSLPLLLAALAGLFGLSRRRPTGNA